MEIMKLVPTGKDYLWGGTRLREEQSSFSKELSQDSRADKSQQLKKETKNQQKDAQRQRGNLLNLRRLSPVSFSGFARAKTEQFQSEPLR